MTTEEFLDEWHSPSPTVMVHTSGSTGKPKPMLVEKQRMLNSARITCDFLGLKSGDTALLCMPLDYIAGKMMVVRSIERELLLYTVKPSNHPLATTDDTILNKAFDDGIDFAAMVPSQVFCSLQIPEERERLRKIKRLIIGGGAISRELQDALSKLYAESKREGQCEMRVFSTYGMTETLSHIALRELVGPDVSEWYTPFDSVSISLDKDNCLVINAPLVHDGELHTNDIAEITEVNINGLSDSGSSGNDSSGNDSGSKKIQRFRILGRRDNIICSGGIKLKAEEIEDAIRPFMSAPFAITKRHDEKFGEAVVLLMEQDVTPPLHLDNPYFMPKDIIHVDHIPMTETGKIKRSELMRLV